MLSGEAWGSGRGFVQDVYKWAPSIAPATVVSLSSLGYEEFMDALEDSAVRRYVLVRDPIERAVSSFYSKVACGSGDHWEHTAIVEELERQEAQAATQLQA